MIYKDRNYRWALTDGVTPNYAEIMNLSLRSGRWLTEMDNFERRNVLVIGANAVDALFDGDADAAIGKVIRMNGTTGKSSGSLKSDRLDFLVKTKKIGKSSCHFVQLVKKPRHGMPFFL